MAFQDVDVLGPEANPNPVAEKAEKVESALVLKHVHAVCKAHNAAALCHDELAGDEIVVTVVSVVAGVEDHHSGIRGDIVDFLKDNAFLKVFQRVGLYCLRVFVVCHPGGIQPPLGKPALYAVRITAGHAADIGMEIVCRLLVFRRSGKIHPEPVSVLVEYHKVHIRTAEFLDYIRLHVILHAVAQVAGLSVFLEDVSELLVYNLPLCPPGRDGIGV